MGAAIAFGVSGGHIAPQPPTIGRTAPENQAQSQTAVTWPKLFPQALPSLNTAGRRNSSAIEQGAGAVADGPIVASVSNRRLAVIVRVDGTSGLEGVQRESRWRRVR